MSDLPTCVTIDAATDAATSLSTASVTVEGQHAVRDQNQLNQQLELSTGTQNQSRNNANSALRSVKTGISTGRSCPSVLSMDAMPTEVLHNRNCSRAHASENASFLPSDPSNWTLGNVQEHLVHKVTKAVSGKNRKDEFSENVSSSNNTNLPFSSDIDEQDIKDRQREMPLDLREDYQDAMILYSQNDIESVFEFENRVNDIVLRNGIKPKLVLYTDLAASIGSKIKTLEFGIERCTYIFLYITSDFCGDPWTEFSSETCLIEAIHNPSKKWCVVPVFTKPKRNSDLRVPPSLNSLKGIQYWTKDKFFRDAMLKLLEEKMHVRINNQRKLDNKRKDWVVEAKIREMHQMREEQVQRAKRQQMLQQLELEREQAYYQPMSGRSVHFDPHSQRSTQCMMEQFARRFGVRENYDPPLTYSHFSDRFEGKDDGEEVNLAARSAIHYDQNVPHKQRLKANIPSEGCSVSQCPVDQSFLSLPHPGQEHQGNPRQFHSLPMERISQPSDRISSESDFRDTIRSETRGSSPRDLEEDYASMNSSYHGQVPGESFAESSSKKAPVAGSHLGNYRDTGLVGSSHQGRYVTPSTALPTQEKQEIHYHYHFDQPNDKGGTKNKDDQQQPVTIINPQIVQIGHGNKVVNTADNTNKEEKKVETHDSGRSHIEPTSTISKTPVPSGVGRSDFQSSIYQDNPPSTRGLSEVECDETQTKELVSVFPATKQKHPQGDGSSCPPRVLPAVQQVQPVVSSSGSNTRPVGKVEPMRHTPSAAVEGQVAGQSSQGNPVQDERQQEHVTDAQRSVDYSRQVGLGELSSNQRPSSINPPLPALPPRLHSSPDAQARFYGEPGVSGEPSGTEVPHVPSQSNQDEEESALEQTLAKQRALESEVD